MLRVALPNKGGLAEDAARLVREAGYGAARREGELVLRDVDNQVEFFFIRPRDIVVYVARGDLDLGITGRDMIVDSRMRVAELLPLDFAHSAFYYAVPVGSGLTPEVFGGLRVATSYACIVADDLAARGIEARIVHLEGAVEVSVDLGVADLVADVVQSGRTIAQAGLETVGEPLLCSEAVLVGRRESTAAQRFQERLQGIVVARRYALIEYDVEEDRIDAACAVTPGIVAPTVMPLYRAGWVGVRAMIERGRAARVMDQLKILGAVGIVLADMRSCRI